jgi:hypothetical protein
MAAAANRFDARDFNDRTGLLLETPPGCSMIIEVKSGGLSY